MRILLGGESRIFQKILIIVNQTNEITMLAYVDLMSFFLKANLRIFQVYQTIVSG